MRHPALIPTGGLHQDKADPRHDPDANVIVAVKLTCDVCGYMLLIDNEKFHPSSEKTLSVGSEAPDAEWEAEQGTPEFCHFLETRWSLPEGNVLALSRHVRR